MTAHPEAPAWKPRWVPWLLHSAGLFAAMAAPLFLLGPEMASLAAVGVGLLYYLGWVIAYVLSERRKPKPPAKVRLLANLYSLSVPFAVFGLMLFLIVEWLLWAYRPLSRSVEYWNGGMIALVAITATFIVPALLFLLLAPRLVRSEGGPASRFLAGVRARGFGWFQGDWLSGMAGWGGLLALMSVFFTGTLLPLVQRVRDSDGVVTAWDLIVAFPVLPFALLAVAALQPLPAFLFPDWHTNDLIIPAYIEGKDDPPLLDPGTRTALGGMTAAACIAGLLAIVYPLHLGMTGKAYADGISALKGTIEALRILVNTHEDDDWANAEIVAALNRFGHWTPDAPEAGLGSLVADPGEAFPETCTVRIAAGLLDASAGEPRSQFEVAAGEPDMKLCLAVACAPPYSWHAPPALLLVTSHDSEAEGWRSSAYFDVFADGVAAAPGGYCTETGELADSYQG